MTLADFARSTVECVGAHIDGPDVISSGTDPRLLLLCKSLALGRKILRLARKTHSANLSALESDEEESQLDTSHLFTEASEPASGIPPLLEAPNTSEPASQLLQPDPTSEPASQLLQPDPPETFGENASHATQRRETPASHTTALIYANTSPAIVPICSLQSLAG